MSTLTSTLSIAPASSPASTPSPPTDYLERIFQRQKEAFLQQGAPSASERKAVLRRLEKLLKDHQTDLARAISTDFGHRSRHETLLAEVFATISGIKHSARHLASWMKPEHRSVALHFLPGRAEVLHQPLGVVGVIAPWNYPVGLALAPLAAALAAGNRVMLKPSEYTPATSALLTRLLGENFPDDQVAVVTGGADVGAAFAHLPFDQLIFTGSTTVGRAVMQAASENLVPVTLELGGKSPVLIDSDYSLKRAVRSIAHAKMLNAGQTCVAPDYVLLPAHQIDSFIALFSEQVGQFYPSLVDNPDYTSMASRRHYDRMQQLVDDARAKGARVVKINPANEDFREQAANKFPPTLLLDVTDDMTVMQDEIFGPVLPIKPYRDLDEAIAYVNSRPRPLALYYFGNDRERQQQILTRTTSGGVTINDTMLHYLQEGLPFGGVGPSGMGAYHGREGFLTFSHQKAVFRQAKLNAVEFLQPPFGKLFERLMAVLVR
jgi:coniferyl-aldehyde dehydrogenase